MANAAAAELVLNMEVTEKHFGSNHRLVVMTTKRNALPPKAVRVNGPPLSWNLARMDRLGEALNDNIATLAEGENEEGELEEMARQVIRTVKVTATRVLGRQIDQIRASGKTRSNRVRAAEEE